MYSYGLKAYFLLEKSRKRDHICGPRIKEVNEETVQREAEINERKMLWLGFNTCLLFLNYIDFIRYCSNSV